MPDDVTTLPRVSHATLIAFITSAYRAAGVTPRRGAEGSRADGAL